jgi:hypothetical protein
MGGSGQREWEQCERQSGERGHAGHRDPIPHAKDIHEDLLSFARSKSPPEEPAYTRHATSGTRNSNRWENSAREEKGLSDISIIPACQPNTKQKILATD